MLVNVLIVLFSHGRQCEKKHYYCCRPVKLGASVGEAGIIYQPLSHLLGSALAFAALTIGAYSVIVPRFHMKMYLDLVAEHKVSLQERQKRHPPGLRYFV